MYLTNRLPKLKKTLAIGFTTLALAMSFNAVGKGVELMSEAEVEGKAIFKKYGINDDLPKLGMSSLLQGEHLVEHVSRSVTINDEVRQSEAYLVQNTDEKGNIDLRIKYDPAKLDENDDVIAEIENATKIEYRLRNYAQSYDPSTVTATELDNGQVEIAFNYSKYGLPQDIAYFRNMRVKVIVENGQPVSMIIKNTKPFAYEKYTITEYRQLMSFVTLTDGRVVLEEKSISAKGSTSKGEPVTLATTVAPVVFYDDLKGANILSEDRLMEVSDPRFREAKIKLDRVFPLMGDMVRRQGIDVPLPFGVSVAYRKQDMNFGFTDFDIMGQELNEFFDPLKSIADVSAESFTVRGDVNILPFWNVYGLVGKIKVDANVDAEYTGQIGQEIKETLNNKLPGLGNAFCDGLSALCNRGTVSVPLNLNYDVVGVGTTLSVGYKQFFASVTGTYSKTRMEGSDKWGDGILTIQPMLGYQFAEYRAQIFVGAEYQGLKPNMEGEIAGVELGGETFYYNVGVDLDKWAYLIGFNKQFGKNYNLSVLYNQGETRNAFTVNFGYRF
ncbi:hypothetical protein [Shewanella gaetbuli]|uniref:Uncharacterized protein n=1 Tax=Shewanella gaetbuli TaxID=220752 RepID=A0A9X1ZQT8_9GAMM|nr:hypothetical protein [Shewanella gaetbuli]MCL1142393.1 hypothetical protein [Shewanella gaetbuli]